MTLERDIESSRGCVTGCPRARTTPPRQSGPCSTTQGAGIPMPPRNEGMRLWGGEVFVFPNFFVLPMYGNALSYRIRPYNDDPE